MNYTAKTEFKLSELVNLTYPMVYQICHDIISDIMNFFQKETNWAITQTLKNNLNMLLNKMANLCTFDRSKIIQLRWETVKIRINNYDTDINVSNNGLKSLKPNYLLELIYNLVKILRQKTHRMLVNTHRSMENHKFPEELLQSLNLDALSQQNVDENDPRSKDASYEFISVKLSFPQ